MLERLIWHIIIHLKYFTLWLAPITPLSFQNYPALTIFGNYGQLMYHGFHHGTFRPSQPRFRADMASNNPVSGAGNEEVNNKIAFSFLSTCIILHINLTSFNRNNANAIRCIIIGLLRWCIMVFSSSPCISISVILIADKTSQRSFVSNSISFSALCWFHLLRLFELKIGYFLSLLLRRLSWITKELSRKRTQKMNYPKHKNISW